MQLLRDKSLADLTTMRLGGTAAHVATVENESELLEALAYAETHNLPYFVLGGGSNVIARDEGFDGLLILARLKGFEILDSDGDSTLIRIAAGENWDETVARTVEMGLSGIEAMSAIPGTTGATPVQNVGAYGQEIADTLIELRAYDTDSKEFVTLLNAACGFSYRDSIFKDPATRRHIIVSITLRLHRAPMRPPFYGSLQHYLDINGITDYSPHIIRNAVTAIRQTKLPDPRLIANTGSFFKNPIVSKNVAKRLQLQYSDMPSFPMDDSRAKLAAGWLIEQAGMRGHAAHGFTTFSTNALVVVNENSSSYHDLLAFTREIIGAVRDKFGIVLEQEPETL